VTIKSSFFTWAVLAVTAAVPASAQFYLQKNLVSDISGMAQVTDSHLVNPWGVALGSTGPFWVSNAGTSTSIFYSVAPSTAAVSALPLVVNVPAPTGQVHA